MSQHDTNNPTYHRILGAQDSVRVAIEKARSQVDLARKQLHPRSLRRWEVLDMNLVEALDALTRIKDYGYELIGRTDLMKADPRT